jgi:hypothetical protein
VLSVLISVGLITSLHSLARADEISCTFKDDVKSIIETRITGVRNVKTEVYPHQDNNRKCFVNFEAQIDGNWIPTSGSKVFDRDMSEAKACSLAKTNGKKTLLEKLGIETVTATKNKHCKETIVKTQSTPKPAPVAPVVVDSLPALTPTVQCQKYTRKINVRGRQVSAWGMLCNENGEWVKR